MLDMLEQIAELSHEFGTEEYVLGGGGNTSAKDADHLWIKPSGTALPTMTPESFLKMNRAEVAKLNSVEPPENVTEREAMVTQMLADAKDDVDDPRRPSVETPLHNAFSAKYVVHTHPPLVGGLVCGKNSQQVCEELFPEFLYMAFTDPGYVLSMRTTEEIIAYKEKNGKEPSAIFMENHGVFVAGDTAQEIRDIFSVIMTTLKDQYSKAGIPASLSQGPEPDQDHVSSVVDTVRAACGDEHVAYTESSGVFDVAEGPLTPDHIVYMKSFAFMGEPTKEAVVSFVDEYGFAPRIVKTEKGVVSFGTTENNARLAMELAKDGAVVAKLTAAFGGPRFLSREAWMFIDNWEVESYRRKLAAG